MTTLALPLRRRQEPRPFDNVANPPDAVLNKQRLLVWSDDEPFWRNLSSAANQTGCKLVRKRATDDTKRLFHLVKPAAVLLDLDLRAGGAWDAADSLLQDENCPLVFLLTSRSDHLDFQTAIQAGCLLDKSADAAALIHLVNQKLDSAGPAYREQNAMQRIMIRWLKPVSFPTQMIPLQRFWGINE